MKGRRRFVAIAGGAAVSGTWAACGGGSSPVAPSSMPTPSPAVSEVHVPLMAVGQTVPASVSLVGGLSTPLAVTRLTEAEVVAVSRICTHMGCTVALPTSAGGTLDCPCHGSRYRTDGLVVNGPATRNLASFPASISGGEVVISTGA